MSFSIQSIYNWYRDTLRNPKYRWWLVLGTLVYVISPFDIAPDFIPIAGQIDDVILITLLVSEVSQFIIEMAKQKVAAKPTETDTKPVVDVDSVSLDS
jgi:uncharacterized membrane protein YkvA (DUF1232 family)